MSNYPPWINFVGGWQDKITYYCSDCEEEWDAPIYWDLGSWFLWNEEQAYCIHCGKKGKPV